MFTAVRFGTMARTALALGPINIARVILYRLGLRSGMARVCRTRFQLSSGPFFKPQPSDFQIKPVSQWRDRALYFGWFSLPVSRNSCPDWHLNPFTGTRVHDTRAPWWRIPDFDPGVGDIKTIWEASRLDWVLAMVQRGVSGEADEWKHLNCWLEDWCRGNPPYLGPNWKCGQEASIRLMHLAMAALIGRQEKSSCPGLLDLIEAHLTRIAPTIQYAMAQDNNHGTSEAAALFIGGSWLARTGRTPGNRWEWLGRRWLENRVLRLVEPDGSFSQHSVNYHRLMLDTLSIVEVWRRQNGLAPFSATWQAKARAAARWLRAFTDPASGDAPNLGSNDGARLLPLTEADYRDYRPSVQLASALFENGRAYGKDGHWDLLLKWLGVKLPDRVLQERGSELYDYGGYALLRTKEARVILRYPRFRFRPSHADGLHLDFWLNGTNILRDGGSYSYSGEDGWRDYFRGTICHNTIQFDDRDQMPRLGRFLFGDWIRTERRTDLIENEDGIFFSASYTDIWGASHKREVMLSTGKLVVTDSVSGFEDRAVLRWRLMPLAWALREQTVELGELRLTVASETPFQRVELVEGWESRYYLQKTRLPVLEAELAEPGVISSVIAWKP